MIKSKYYEEGERLFKERKFREAFELYTKGWEEGDIRCAASLEYCYFRGYGVEANEEMEEKICRDRQKYKLSLAEGGDAEAQTLLALELFSGDYGSKKDVSKAMEWCTKAAEQGYARAQRKLGIEYCAMHENEKAIEWWTKAGEQGDAPSQYLLGCLYCDGKYVEPDYAKAITWLTKSAEQECSYGQHWLGKCYFFGWGVEQSYEKAIEWWTKSAENDNRCAMKDLSSCYLHGYGVEPNPEMRIEWLRRAYGGYGKESEADDNSWW